MYHTYICICIIPKKNILYVYVSYIYGQKKYIYIYMYHTYLCICIIHILQGSFAKETYNFKKPTNRSHPIHIHVSYIYMYFYTHTHTFTYVLIHIYVFFPHSYIYMYDIYICVIHIYVPAKNREIALETPRTPLLLDFQWFSPAEAGYFNLVVREKWTSWRFKCDFSVLGRLKHNTHHAPVVHELWEAESIAVCCSVLQCVAVCCSVVQCVAVMYIYIIHTTHQWCTNFGKPKVLQCVALCCSVLQCVAVQCIVVQSGIAVCCSVLQSVAVCCKGITANAHKLCVAMANFVLPIGPQQNTMMHTHEPGCVVLWLWVFINLYTQFCSI